MNFQNLASLFTWQTQRLGPRVALRFKRLGLYRDITWSQYAEKAQACAAALVEVGIQPGERIGVWAENSPEWLIADMGILLAGAINVPPHASLTASQVQFQLQSTETQWLFVSSQEQLEKIRKIRPELPTLKGIVVFQADTSQTDFFSWPRFLQKGRRVLPLLREELLGRQQALGWDDLATIMYTSGTMGNPKGVMLTHGNLLSNAAAVDEAFPRSPDSAILSWLPFSHIYARTVDHYLSLITGVTICLAESAETLVTNLIETRPTHISCVPRFYEKLLSTVGSPDVSETRKRLQGIFGSQMQWLGSGGAALPISLARAYEEAGFLILQGYGLTESSPVISFNRQENYKLDSVGQAIPGVEIRIADDGEILTRGPHVMKGYWKNPEATQETIRDSWLYTGDLGHLDEDGFLFITGRKKELLILSNGKKIIPTMLDGVLVTNSLIDQAVVFGEGKNFLSALIVPNWDHVLTTFPDNNLTSQSKETLATHPQILSFFEKQLDDILSDFSPSERIKKFLLLPYPFTVAEGELTVSLKLRRKIIFEKYKDQLETLYQECKR